MPDIDVLVLAALGVVVGALLRSRLVQLGHRLDDERELGRPPSSWVVPATALLTAGLWWATAPDHSPVVPAVHVLAGWTMVMLGFIDLDVHRLPDRIQLPAFPTLATLLAICSLVEGEWTPFVRALVAGVALFVLYLVLALLPGGGIGFGDVKLAGLLGMLLGWHSWTHVLQGTMATFLIGGVVAVALLALRRKGARDDFAYGPPMLVGAAGAIIVPPLLALL